MVIGTPSFLLVQIFTWQHWVQIRLVFLPYFSRIHTFKLLEVCRKLLIFMRKILILYLIARDAAQFLIRNSRMFYIFISDYRHSKLIVEVQKYARFDVFCVHVLAAVWITCRHFSSHLDVCRSLMGMAHNGGLFVLLFKCSYH